jgi:hypothetical protein
MGRTTGSWWQRLMKLDNSYLELISVEPVSTDIQEALEKVLGIVYWSASQRRLSIDQLIRVGLERQTELSKRNVKILIR